MVYIVTTYIAMTRIAMAYIVMYSHGGRVLARLGLRLGGTYTGGEKKALLPV